MVISATVRPKPKKNISSVTTTPNLKRHWQFSSGSKHVLTLPARIYEGQPLSAAPYLRTKRFETNLLNFDHIDHWAAAAQLEIYDDNRPSSDSITEY